MPMRSPYVVQLTKGEQAELLARSREYTSPYRDVVRAKIVLLASQGLGNANIAEHLDTPRQNVSKWRRRFHDERLAGLDELPRSGLQTAFPPRIVVAIKALACELPSRRGLSLARWSVSELCQEATVYRRENLAAPLYGAGSARNYRAPGGIVPGAVPRDRQFARKAGRVLDLYHRRWRGPQCGATPPAMVEIENAARLAGELPIAWERSRYHASRGAMHPG